jgi:hypothetical protein
MRVGDSRRWTGAGPGDGGAALTGGRRAGGSRRRDRPVARVRRRLADERGQARDGRPQRIDLVAQRADARVGFLRALADRAEVAAHVADAQLLVGEALAGRRRRLVEAGVERLERVVSCAIATDSCCCCSCRMRSSAACCWCSRFWAAGCAASASTQAAATARRVEVVIVIPFISP